MYRSVLRGFSLTRTWIFALSLALCLLEAHAVTVSSRPTVTAGVRAQHGTAVQRPGQQRQAQKSKIDTRVEILTKLLALNDVQRFDLRKILESGQSEAKRLWNDQQIAAIDRMLKLRELREQAQKQFHALLTEDQRKKYDEYFQRETQANSTAHTNSPSQVSSPSQDSNKAGH
jgi:hypothetical protein